MSHPRDRFQLALGFGPEDLAANQAFQLSERQRNSLRRYRGTDAWLTFWLLLPALGCTFCLWGVMQAVQFDLEPGIWATIIGLILALILLNGLMGLFGERRDKKKIEADLQGGGVVAMVQGRAKLDIKPRSRRTPTRYLLSIQDQTFELETKNQMLAFQNGESYVVYYAPHTHTLLSAMKMDDWFFSGEADQAPDLPPQG